MKEGFYSVDYQGVAGMGNAVLVLRDGEVFGVDVRGGRYDGHCRPSATPGLLDFTVTVTIPAGVGTVMGPVALSGGLTFEARSRLQANLDYQTVPVKTEYGDIQTVVAFIRAL